MRNGKKVTKAKLRAAVERLLVATGDRDRQKAFAVVHDYLRPSLIYWLSERLGNGEDIDDAAQEIFARLYQYSSDGKSSHRFLALYHRIRRSVVCDVYRQNLRWTNVDSEIESALSSTSESMTADFQRRLSDLNDFRPLLVRRVREFLSTLHELDVQVFWHMRINRTDPDIALRLFPYSRSGNKMTPNNLRVIASHVQVDLMRLIATVVTKELHITVPASFLSHARQLPLLESELKAYPTLRTASPPAREVETQRPAR